MKLSYVILYVNSVQDSTEFYSSALSLEHKFTHESGDYAEMVTGETVLAFCNHKLANDILKQDYVKASLSEIPLGSQITFAPGNVENAYHKAIDAGAKSVAAPEIKPWNFEVAIVQDCDGHIIEFAKNLNES